MQDFITRLEYCAEKCHGKRNLAEKSGISEAQLFRYLKGTSEMSATKVMAIARAAEVEPGWLLTGEGPSNPLKISETDKDQLLEDLACVLEETLVEYEYRLHPRQKAKILKIFLVSLIEDWRRTCIRPELDKPHILGMLDFIRGAKNAEQLDILYRGIMLLIQHEKHLQLVEDELHTFINIIDQCQTHYYDSLSGEFYFQRMGNNLREQDIIFLEQALTQHTRFASNTPLSFLDVGCGNGRVLTYLAQNHPHKIKLSALDSSERALNHINQLELAGRIPQNTVLKGSCYLLPYPDAHFDYVYSRCMLFLHPYIADTRLGLIKVLEEMARVLKPGGIVGLNILRGEGRKLVEFEQYLMPEQLITAAEKLGLEQQQLLIPENSATKSKQESTHTQNATYYYDFQYFIFKKK